ncbi:MAG: hypothetical protein AABY10_05965 [Nanoarchaeota archaeon]
MKNAEDRATFAGQVYNWVGELFSHVWQITGFVVNSEWLPKDMNESKSSFEDSLKITSKLS